MHSRQRGCQRSVDSRAQSSQRIARQRVVLDIRVVDLAQQSLEMPHILRPQQRKHAPCSTPGFNTLSPATRAYILIGTGGAVTR